MAHLIDLPLETAFVSQPRSSEPDSSSETLLEAIHTSPDGHEYDFLNGTFLVGIFKIVAVTDRSRAPYLSIGPSIIDNQFHDDGRRKELTLTLIFSIAADLEARDSDRKRKVSLSLINPYGQIPGIDIIPDQRPNFICQPRIECTLIYLLDFQCLVSCSQDTVLGEGTFLPTPDVAASTKRHKQHDAKQKHRQARPYCLNIMLQDLHLSLPPR